MLVKVSSKINEPDSIAVGRSKSIFIEDIEDCNSELLSRIKGSKILVIGGAGSIGSSTIDVISRFEPKAIHVVDQNENGLAELIRNLRSRSEGLNVEDFRALPINYGGKAFEYYLQQNGPFDYMLNFAALKHVRSEKDHYSTLEMLNTNLMLMSNLIASLDRAGAVKRFFSVSTDKAANPSSMMGASKRLMEHFLFDKSLARPADMITTSARFANVAYSNGSLLQSFHNRFNQKQPLVAPKDCKRYFVSLNESGQICTLAAFIAPQDTIAIPNLAPEKNLILLEDVLFGFLRHKGFEPAIFESESLARESVDYCIAKGQWPVMLTPLDTAGEKPYEEFVAQGETKMDIGLKALSGVSYRPAVNDNVAQAKEMLKEILSREIDSDKSRLSIQENELRDLIASVEPAFLDTHRASTSSLDQRM